MCCGGLAAALQAARLRGPTNKVRVATRAMSAKIINWLAVDAQKLTASKHANALMQFPHNLGGRARGNTMQCRRQGCREIGFGVAFAFGKVLELRPVYVANNNTTSGTQTQGTGHRARVYIGRPNTTTRVQNPACVVWVTRRSLKAALSSHRARLHLRLPI